MRALSPEEAALWARVAATIRPLSREPATHAPETAPPGPVARPLRQTLAGASGTGSEPARPSIGSTLDSGWDRRLRSGDVEPDALLDLHGLNLDQAWNAIDRGLERAIAEGRRILLLVTGHERPGGPHVSRGKIRSVVHDWLQVSRHASKIAAVRPAHKRHGAGGSLYIILRRNRPKSTVS